MIRIFLGILIMFMAASVNDTESIYVMIILGLIGLGISLYGVQSCNKDPSIF